MVFTFLGNEAQKLRFYTHNIQKLFVAGFFAKTDFFGKLKKIVAKRRLYIANS